MHAFSKPTDFGSRLNYEDRSLPWVNAASELGRLRAFGDGWLQLFGHLDICPACGSRVATTPNDRAAVAALVDQQLL